jgi:uncharacterized membrane protein
MSRALRAVWDNAYGLLVDDGQLALGAVGALALTGVVAALVPSLRDEAGWLLLALVVILVLANLYAAALNARRRGT